MDAKEIRAVLQRAKRARFTAVECAVVMALLLANDLTEDDGRHNRRALEHETQYSKAGINKALKSLQARGWITEAWDGCALHMEVASGIRRQRARA